MGMLFIGKLGIGKLLSRRLDMVLVLYILEF